MGKLSFKHPPGNEEAAKLLLLIRNLLLGSYTNQSFFFGTPKKKAILDFLMAEVLAEDFESVSLRAPRVRYGFQSNRDSFSATVRCYS